jgi:hypothetical protein
VRNAGKSSPLAAVAVERESSAAFEKASCGRYGLRLDSDFLDANAARQRRTKGTLTEVSVRKFVDWRDGPCYFYSFWAFLEFWILYDI